jgi:beta-glucosidase
MLLQVADLVVFATGTAHPLHEQPMPPYAVYRDAAAPVNVRVADLLSRMNMDEKVAQLLNPFGSADSILSQYNATHNGIGGAWGARLTGGDPRFMNVQDAQNFLQETVINNSRHGIPVSVYVEGLHGGPGGGTIFPSPVNMGNSWNASLLKMVGAAVAHEARIGGCDRVFAPELQVDTDPRFGRFYESFAEDPHLVSVYGYFMTQVGGPFLRVSGRSATPLSCVVRGLGHSRLDWTGRQLPRPDECHLRGQAHGRIR